MISRRNWAESLTGTKPTSLAAKVRDLQGANLQEAQLQGAGLARSRGAPGLTMFWSGGPARRTSSR